MGRHHFFSKIKELTDEIERLEQVIRNEAREAAKSLSPKWEYKVYPNVQTESSWHSKIAVGQEYVIIHRTLVNSDEYKKHLHYYGSSPINPPNESNRSVRYFVKNGVLFHDGGGYIMLEDGEIVSPEDWEDIKAGKLEKYLR